MTVEYTELNPERKVILDTFVAHISEAIKLIVNLKDPSVTWTRYHLESAFLWANQAILREPEKVEELQVTPPAAEPLQSEVTLQ